MNRVIAMALAAAFGWVGAVSAQEAAPLSAIDSNPKALGWMQGFPPSEDALIRQSGLDFLTFPKLRWAVCHLRQFMPTVAVGNGDEGARALPEALKPGLGAVTFTPLGDGADMTWDAAFDANYTDGVIVLHHGRIVYERYDGCLDKDALHGAMSLTGSLTGLLAEILVAEGALNDSARVGDLIPELNGSAFGDATVRQVMDMTTALDFPTDDSTPNADAWASGRVAIPTRSDTEGDEGPHSTFEFLQTVQSTGKPGAEFASNMINADVLGWLIARASKMSVADLLSRRIWSRLGTQREGYYTVDSAGAPFAGGGFNATLRDMARLGQLMLDGGRAGSAQIVPERVIAAITQRGDRADDDTPPAWRNRSMWWISDDDHDVYAASGAHGQMLWIDPAADMVIARYASHPKVADGASAPTSLPAFRAVAQFLIENDDMPLAGREWRIEDVEGMGVIDFSNATLKFMPDGALAGSATCNRLIGSYKTDGDALTIQPVGATMMACPEALMAQEQRILGLLPKIERFVIDETGALILIAADGRTIAARR